MIHIKRTFKDESGVTLVEMLAAITILSIIVTAFLAFFVQAGQTNNMTTENNEATFLAQEEIERMTHLSNQGEVVSVGEVSEEKDGYNITTTIEDDSSSDLYKVIVTVEGGRGRAKMETRLPFAEE